MGLFGQKQRKSRDKANSQASSGSHATRLPTARLRAIRDVENPSRAPRPSEVPGSITRASAPYSNGGNYQSEMEKCLSQRLTTPTHPMSRSSHDLIGLDSRDKIRDVVSDQFSEVITLIDEDSYHGPDRDFIVKIPVPDVSEAESDFAQQVTDRAVVTFAQPQLKRQPKQDTRQQSDQVGRSVNFFSKVSYYSNSKLPPSLPTLRVYIPTWPLFCLAAQYSNAVYQDADLSARLDTSTFVPSNATLGTKAMVITSHPCDSQKTMVFAIRGTSILSLRDWNTNLHVTPTQPTNFLDDDGNLCHAGFLRVARAMVRPIAIRLRHLLEQNPSRSACSLLITGHSAGGAVAALLYAHMLSQTVQSDLTILASCFKRVHCVTFGAPPVSLLPLSKPNSLSSARNQHNMDKCLFHSFMNEGDPVVRAEKSYVKSLIDLVTTQIPPSKENIRVIGEGLATSLPNISRLDLNLGTQIEGGKKKLRKLASRPKAQAYLAGHRAPHLEQPETSWGEKLPIPDAAVHKTRPMWSLPPSTLSNAGRLVVLRIAPSLTSRSSNNSRSEDTEMRKPRTAYLRHEFETVRAEIVTDEQLREVVFGDPLMHGMEIYRRRVEALAMKAVTGGSA